MRILVVVPHYFPAIGGVEAYSRAIVKHLKSLGHEVTVVTTGEKAGRETLDAVRVIRLKPLFRLSNTPINPLWYFTLRKLIRTVKPDVIHAHSPVPFLADMAVLTAGKRPVHITYHAGSMKKGAGGLIDGILGFYETHLLPRLFKKAASVGAVLPDFVKKHAQASTKIAFTPPGIDTATYTPDRSRQRDIDVVFVGRLETTSKWKGVDILLEALKKLTHDKPLIRAAIIGKGDAVAEYQSFVKAHGLDKNVEFITTLTGEEVIPYYQRAKIVVLPSKTEAESFGMALAEGMASGAAAIGSRIGGIPSVIEHEKSGLLVTPNNTEELAMSIRRLLNNPELREMLAKNGTTQIREQFSLESMLEKNTALLEAATKKPIVHVVAYYPPYMGGMESATSMLTHRLHDRGRVISVVTSRETATQTKITFPFTVQRLRTFTVASTPLIPRLFFALFKTPSNSIFHIHIAQAGIPEVAFLAAKLRRIPVIMHLHGDVEASSSAGILLPLYKKIFLGFVLRHATSVIVPTKTYQKTITKRYGLKNQVHVIPTGVDESFFFEKQSTTPRASTTILYTGRLTVEKNIDLLIEAVGKVKYPIRFVIAGDGPLRQTLEKKAKEAASSQHIEFVGRKSAKELQQYYNDADIFVLASNYESQSLSTLEAMASGTPAIVANVDAVNEIVGEWGIVTEKSARGFTEAITMLIENPVYHAELSQKAKQRAEEFSWQTLLPKFEDVYDSLT